MQRKHPASLTTYTVSSRYNNIRRGVTTNWDLTTITEVFRNLTDSMRDKSDDFKVEHVTFSSEYDVTQNARSNKLRVRQSFKSHGNPYTFFYVLSLPAAWFPELNHIGTVSLSGPELRTSDFLCAGTPRRLDTTTVKRWSHGGGASRTCDSWPDERATIEIEFADLNAAEVFCKRCHYRDTLRLAKGSSLTGKVVDDHVALGVFATTSELQAIIQAHPAVPTGETFNPQRHYILTSYYPNGGPRVFALRWQLTKYTGSGPSYAVAFFNKNWFPGLVSLQRYNPNLRIKEGPAALLKSLIKRHASHSLSGDGLDLPAAYSDPSVVDIMFTSTESLLNFLSECAQQPASTYASIAP